MQRILDDRRVLYPTLVTALVIAVGALLIVVLGGSASGGAATASPAAGTGASGAVTVDIADFKYKPETLTVQKGASVTWVNHDSSPHTATARGAFDTDTLKKGDEKTLKLAKAGTFDYICEFHPFMKATVIVR